MGVVLVTVAAAAAVSVRSVAVSPARPPSTGVFVPADGTVIITDLVNNAGETLLVQEHQHLTGVTALTALPDGIAAQMLGSIGSEGLEERRYWRVTSRQMRDGLVGPQTHDLWTMDESGLARVAAFGGPYPSVFDPPLMIIPANFSPGDTWNATGSALFAGTLAYAFEASVLAVDGECVEVGSRLDLTLGEAPLLEQSSTERWCRGRGLVSAEAVFDQGLGPQELELILSTDPSRRLGGQPRPGVPTDVTPQDPSAWVARALRPTYRDALLGDLGLGGVTGRAPVVGPDGMLIVVLGNGSDLLALRSGVALEGTDGSAEPLLEQWRAHPGGEPIAVAVLEDLVVVSTARRRLVAYDLNGVRRWLVETSDLVVQPPIRVSSRAGDLVVAQDLSGAVIGLDVDTGDVRWRQRTRTESDLGPVSLGDLAVVADRSGDLVAIDAASGERRWERDVSGIGGLAAVADRLVITRDDTAVQALDREGRTLWETELDTWRGRLDEVAGQVGLIGAHEVVVLDASTGDPRFRVPVGEAADGWSGGLGVLEGDEICLFDARGDRLACWPSPTEGASSTRFLVATSHGLWSLDSDLRVVFVGNRPGGLGGTGDGS